MLIEIDENPRKTSSTLFMFARDLKNQASKPNKNKSPTDTFSILLKFSYTAEISGSERKQLFLIAMPTLIIS